MLWLRAGVHPPETSKMWPWVLSRDLSSVPYPHFSLDVAVEQLPLSGACKVCSQTHQVFSFPGPLSQGERVTPHWLLGSRTRRAVTTGEKVSAEIAPFLCTVWLGPAPQGLHGGIEMETGSLQVL